MSDDAAMLDRIGAVMGVSDTPAPKEPKAPTPQTPPPTQEPPADPEADEIEALAGEPDPDDPPAVTEPVADDSIELEIGEEKTKLTKAELKARLEEHKGFKETAEALKTQRQAIEQERRLAHEITQLAPMVEAFRAEGRLLLQAMNTLDQEARSLAESDPIASYQKREQFNGLKQRFDHLAQQDQQASAYLKNMQAQQYQQQLAAEAPRLLEKLPKWKDPAKRDSDMKFIRSYMQQEGYTPEHVAMVTDSRYVATLLKAAKYDAITAARASKKVTAAPPMARAGTVSSPGVQAAAAKSDYRKAVNSANSKGKSHEAAKLVQQELERRLFKS